MSRSITDTELGEVQQGLGDYGVDVAEDSDSQVREEPETIDVTGSADGYAAHTLDRSQLPDIEGFDWEGRPVQRGPAEVLEYWRLDSDFHEDLSHENIPGTGAVVISGADAYLEEHAIAEIDVPDYYTRFEELDTRYRWSADGQTHISYQFLKRAVRLSNGYGNIDPVTTRVVLCDTGFLFVTGPRGAFLIDLPPGRPLRNRNDLPEPPEGVYEDIRGISIPEENPTLRQAFERYLTLLSESSLPSPTGHAGFNEVDHILKTSEGKKLVGENSLRIINGQANSYTDTVGVYSKQCEGATHVVTVDSTHLPGEVGDKVTIEENSGGLLSSSESTTGIVSGYRTEWREETGVSRRHSGVTKLNFNVVVGILKQNLTVTRRRLPIATFEPYNNKQE